MWVNYCVIISRCKKALASCSWMHYGPVKGCKPSFSVFLNVHIVHLTHMSPRTVVYWHHHHHHHHVHEGLGVFPVPWSSKWNWSLHLFLGRPMSLRPFGLYCNACFGILFVSILCTFCSHFFWYCFIPFIIFCAPVLYWHEPNFVCTYIKPASLLKYEILAQRVCD